MTEVATDMFQRVALATHVVTWFADLGSSKLLSAQLAESADRKTQIASEGIENQLLQSGTVGDKFEWGIKDFLTLIDSDEAASFEQGLTLLSAWLGFDATRPIGQAVPDNIWRLADSA